MSVEKVDVGDYAEDDDKLKETFKEKSRYDATSVESWQTGEPPKARGPYDRTTALVIKHDSKEGTVKVFSGNENVLTIQTHQDSEKGPEMIVLPPGYYCWWTLGAQVKYIA